MRRAARIDLSGPLRAAGVALLMLGAAAPALAQMPPPPPAPSLTQAAPPVPAPARLQAAPPVRPQIGAPAAAPPPASAYADAVPEAARARDAGESRGGAWPAPPRRRPGEMAGRPAPPLLPTLNALETAALPAASLAPMDPAPPPPRGELAAPSLDGPAGAPALDAAASAPAPETAASAPPLDPVASAPPLDAVAGTPPLDASAGAPALRQGADLRTAAITLNAAPTAPPRRSLAEPGSPLAATVSILPPARPSASARQPSRAVASVLPDPRSSVRPPRGAAASPRGERDDPGAGPGGVAGGGLCGDPRLAGRPQTPIDGPGRCGIEAPVELTHVRGVPLTPPAVINCRTARIFGEWLEKGPLREAPRMLHAEVTKVRIAGSYSCRSRNSRPGARLSEHALGNAVDVRAFQLSDGREISPLRSWGKAEAGRFLKAAWTSACGPFGTVLGPGSDGYHMDHLHFDSARRSQAYCR